MLVDGACSIYADRPLTCRTYDCRVFPAAGVSVADEDKALIAERALRWKFDYASERDRGQHAAVRAAARFLREHADSFGGAVPKNSTQLAVLAVKVYDVFLKYHDGDEEARGVKPSAELIKAVTEANPKFEAKPA